MPLRVGASIPLLLAGSGLITCRCFRPEADIDRQLRLRHAEALESADPIANRRTLLPDTPGRRDDLLRSMGPVPPMESWRYRCTGRNICLDGRDAVAVVYDPCRDISSSDGSSACVYLVVIHVLRDPPRLFQMPSLPRAVLSAELVGV